MNAPLRVVKTPAESALAEFFAAAKRSLPGAGELSEAREAAFRSFESVGLPNRRVEEWKYTDLRALMREAKPLAVAPTRAELEKATRAGAVFAQAGLRRLVFVNGAFAANLSDLAALEPGLSIVPMSKALAEQHPLLRGRLNRLAPKTNPAVALNTAFMGDGALIHVAEGHKIDRPIHLCFAHVGEASAVFPRSVLVVENGAKATLVKSFEGPDAVEYQTNSAVEVFVGNDAEVSIDRLQADGDSALHLSTLMVELGARTRLTTASLTKGAAVSRHQIFVAFRGDHSAATIGGANMLRGSQHADTTMLVEHAMPHGNSRETIKTVLDDESRGVFQGKIIVRPEAQKTDGKMASHAVLLSEAAEMDNKPELEIFADDVQCGHGATAGSLDDDLLFYLRARGIPAREAESLLLQSFLGEAIEAVQHDGVRAALTEVVSQWLAHRQ